METGFGILTLWRMRWLVLAAFLSTLVATAALTYTEAPVYQSTASFVVAPNGTYEDALSVANVVDALSRRREIAGTYAQVAASRLIKQQAADRLGLAQADQEALSVSSRLLVDTNVLEISVEGRDPDLVRRFADAVGTRTAVYVGDLYEAYGLKALDSAALPVSPVRPRKLLNLGLGALVGLVLGVGLASMEYYLETALRSVASGPEPAEALPATPEKQAAMNEKPAEA